MSRSYRKNPIRHCCPCCGKKRAKRQAAKRARKIDLSDGANYKRVYEQDDIWEQTCNMNRDYKRGPIPDAHWIAPLTVELLRFYWNK
jgi:hypothetical protein